MAGLKFPRDSRWQSSDGDPVESSCLTVAKPTTWVSRDISGFARFSLEELAFSEGGVMRHRRFLPVVVLAVLLASACAIPRGPLANAGVPNYDEVNKQLSRGAQPSAEGVTELATRGVVTIINLRPESEDPSAAAREKAAAHSLMKHYEPVALSKWFAPQEKDISRILNIISDPTEQPVFVHCQRGADRTGTVVAIYRITHDCWNAEEAIREAGRHGMGWWQFPMRRFIRTWYRTKRVQPCIPGQSTGAS